MAVSSDPAVLIEQSKCMKCIPVGMQPEVIIYLLQQIAENTMTPDQLMQASACMKCIPVGLQKEVMIYLMDQIVQSLA